MESSKKTRALSKQISTPLSGQRPISNLLPSGLHTLLVTCFLIHVASHLSVLLTSASPSPLWPDIKHCLPVLVILLQTSCVISQLGCFWLPGQTHSVSLSMSTQAVSGKAPTTFPPTNKDIPWVKVSSRNLGSHSYYRGLLMIRSPNRSRRKWLPSY